MKLVEVEAIRTSGNRVREHEALEGVGVISLAVNHVDESIVVTLALPETWR